VPKLEPIDDLKGFYEDCYAVGDADPGDAERYGRWRAVGAQSKADHVMTLCRRAGLAPASVLDVGCGDGVVLERLAAAGFAPRLRGCELSARAAAMVAGRAGVEGADIYDGEHLPHPDGAFDLGILSHVLEHVPEPAAVLRETARVCRDVVIEVPLEDNRSARRPEKRAHAHEIGHLHAFSRSDVRAFVEAAGLRVDGELIDPLPREMHAFFAATPRERATADAKWLMRRGLAVVPPVGLRLMTVHFAALCRPR
jgi:SAM-dependent methyltransferase